MRAFIIAKKTCEHASMKWWTGSPALAHVRHRVAEEDGDEENLQQVADP